jgi:hypothetical protein
MLPCWDIGRIDKRRIHEPFEEKESLASSKIGATPVGLLLEDFGGVIWLWDEDRRGVRLSCGLPGREGENKAAASGVDLLLVDEGGREVGHCQFESSSACPKTTPVAAAATAVLAPTSWSTAD